VFVGFHFFEERVEGFEAGFPVLAELLGPLDGVFEWCGVEAAEVLAAMHSAADEIRGFEDSDVLGRGGEGHFEGCGEVGEVSLAPGELADDGAAGGVGQGVEDGVEAWGLI